VGKSPANPHETSLVHLGKPRGLKGLLHALNATVAPTKRCAPRALLEDEQSLSVGVFVWF